MNRPFEVVVDDGLLGRFLLVPAGRFERGSLATPDEGPVSGIVLGSYVIGETPVTNRQYSVFVHEVEHRKPPLLDDAQFGRPDHPVVGVSWHDAVAFCSWLGNRLGHPFALPTEAQWERAARGDQGATYPWGDAPPSPSLLNTGGTVGATSPVDAYQVRSPHGLLGCLGNVWEWCADWYDASYYGHAPDANPPGPAQGIAKVARGGSWRSETFRATCAHRCFAHPSIRSDRHGFRAAAAAPAGV